MSVEFPLCASGVVCITDDKLPKMVIAVKIQIYELNSQGPLPRTGDPTMGLNDNLMLKSPEHYLHRARTALFRNRLVGCELQPVQADIDPR